MLTTENVFQHVQMHFMVIQLLMNVHNVVTIVGNAQMDRHARLVITDIILILQVHVPNVILLVMDVVEKVIVIVNNVQ